MSKDLNEISRNKALDYLKKSESSFLQSSPGSKEKEKRKLGRERAENRYVLGNKVYKRMKSKKTNEETMEKLETLIESIIEENPLETKNAIADIMLDKVRNAILDKKAVMAQQFFDASPYYQDDADEEEEIEEDDEDSDDDLEVDDEDLEDETEEDDEDSDDESDEETDEVDDGTTGDHGE